MIDIVLIVQKITNSFSTNIFIFLLVLCIFAGLILAYKFSKGYKEEEENSDYFFGGLLAIVGIIFIILFFTMVKIT
jgi:heme/copper-type cytochrome/quinol oxidase subunit 2